MSTEVSSEARRVLRISLPSFNKSVLERNLRKPMIHMLSRTGLMYKEAVSDCTYMQTKAKYMTYTIDS